MPIEILFQDKNILVCIKQPGADSEKLLPLQLKEQCKAQDIRVVHRLDKAVGGIMVFALTEESAKKLSAAAAGNGLRKEYFAVVHGCPKEKTGEMTDYLFRDSQKNKSYVVKRMRKGVREAKLKYEVVDCDAEYALVKIRLLTGRTHQIRVQFSSRGYPLVGDGKYGSPVHGDEIALWSRKLSFSHPVSRKELCFETALPEKWPWTLF